MGERCESGTEEEPLSNEPLTDESLTGRLLTGERLTDEPLTDEPLTDEPLTQESLTDESITDQPLTDKPRAATPHADAPHADAPHADAPPTAPPGRQGRQRLRTVLWRSASFVGRTVRGEWHGIVVDPVRQLVRRGLSGLTLAFVAAFGVIFFHALAQRPAGAVVVRILGGVNADLPLWLALLRTPVSLYVPALDLPVWAGITQLFLAFALAELILGRARTLVVSYATTLAGTLMVRVMIALGPGWGGLGLPSGIGRVLDTGPSAAVVGLFTYVAVVRRAPVVFALTSGSMIWESIAVPNLAGREHLIAIAVAIVLALRGRARSRSGFRSRPFVGLRRRVRAVKGGDPAHLRHESRRP